MVAFRKEPQRRIDLEVNCERTRGEIVVCMHILAVAIDNRMTYKLELTSRLVYTATDFKWKFWVMGNIFYTNTEKPTFSLTAPDKQRRPTDDDNDEKRWLYKIYNIDFESSISTLRVDVVVIVSRQDRNGMDWSGIF